MNPGDYPESSWQIPRCMRSIFSPKFKKYVLVVPVWNEGARLKNVLKKLQEYVDLVDVVVVDRGSTDGSTSEGYLRSMRVRALLTLESPTIPNWRIVTGSQLRLGYSFALAEGYEGIITIDGNDKDDVSAIPNFIALLQQGYDFIQASRYATGGRGVNTPFLRDVAIQYIHVPVVSWMAKFNYTDTTQGYRGYSSKLLRDPRLSIFRSDFVGYELLVYLSVNAPRLGYRVTETPVVRTYPPNTKTPTKITFIKGNLALLKTLFDVWRKRYGPK